MLATARLATSRGAVAIAPSVDALSTGLTGQSGSVTFTPAAASGLASGSTTAIPDLSFSGFLATPFASAPGPTAAGTAPAPEPAPVIVPQTPFVTVDGNFLARVSGTAGPITVPGTGATVSAGLVPTNEHLTWGFFPLPGSSTPPALVLSSPDILTFKVSGPGVPTGTLQTLTGSATYVGGLIGNVLGANGVVHQTGQFAQTWNFGTRSGSLNANFDGSSWLGIGLTMPAGANVYAGTGVSKTDQRSLSLQGGFYNSAPVTPGAFPGATGGSFSILPSVLGGSSAGGIFVGTRR